MHGTCLPINAFSYSCKCLQGHGGVLCDEDEDLFNPCQSTRCKHGKCRLSGLGKPYCECSSGYTGDSCDKGKYPVRLSSFCDYFIFKAYDGKIHYVLYVLHFSLGFFYIFFSLSFPSQKAPNSMQTLSTHFFLILIFSGFISRGVFFQVLLEVYVKTVGKNHQHFCYIFFSLYKSNCHFLSAVSFCIYSLPSATAKPNPMILLLVLSQTLLLTSHLQLIYHSEFYR